MDFVLYKARGKNGYLYDISLAPYVDFSILKRTRDIEKFEVISQGCSLEDGIKALNQINGRPSIIGRMISKGCIFGKGEYAVNSALKKYNIKTDHKKIEDDYGIPDSYKISKVENCITGRVVELRKILSFSERFNMSSDEIIQAIQALYCMRRIKIMPAVNRGKHGDVCSLCQKKPCNECCYGFKDDDILLYAANNYGIGMPHDVSCSKTKLSGMLRNAETAINSFLDSKKESAAVWCVSNTFDYRIIASGAANYAGNGKKVLYVTSSLFTYETRNKLAENIQGAYIDISDGYSPNYGELDISICSYNLLPCFHKAFDLVVLDLRYLYLEKTSLNIYYRSLRSIKEKGKIIYILSNTELLKNKYILKNPEIIPIPLTPLYKPVPEPRFVISRYLGNGEWFLPPMVMEMIHWSISVKNGILMFANTKDQMYKLYNYLTGIDKLGEYKIGVSADDDKSQLIGLEKGDINILISSDIKDTLKTIENVNVVVVFEDGGTFDVDTLINMAYMAACHTDQSQGEVVFVAGQEYESMSLAKNAIRNVNKAAWERGYLSK